MCAGSRDHHWIDGERQFYQNLILLPIIPIDENKLSRTDPGILYLVILIAMKMLLICIKINLDFQLTQILHKLGTDFKIIDILLVKNFHRKFKISSISEVLD